MPVRPDQSEPAGDTLDDARSLTDLLRKGDINHETCPSRDVLRHLTTRWAILVMIALIDGTHRFSDLRRKIGGVSEKMLSQTLQTLEADGFVTRVSHPVVPPHVDYSLTPIGREAAVKVRDFADWIELNIGRIIDARAGREAEKETVA